MTDDAVKHEILVGWEYSYLHDDWVNPLEEALKGVTVEEAQRKAKPDSTSIWEIVLHLALWNENIVERIRTGAKAHPDGPSWPRLPDIQDQASWEAAQKRLGDSLEAVRMIVTQTPLDAIQASGYGIADLFCRFTHMGYHLGQITKMREGIA